MKLIAGLIDRLLFAAGLLLFIQLPQFIDHYTQHLAGFWQATAEHVANYQASADLHYNGDLLVMIREFQTDEKPAMRDMGKQMHADVERLPRLTKALDQLRNAPVWRQVAYLATDVDLPIARETAKDFRPGLPLRLDAALCGLVGALLLSGLFNLLVWIPRKLFERPSLPERSY